MFSAITTSERYVFLFSSIAVVATGTAHWMAAGPVLIFLLTTIALATIAYVTGEATGHLGSHLKASTAGMIQSALGNLPELVVCIFALREGAVALVQAALIGSILMTAVLILGIALAVGSARHGLLKFESRTPRMSAVLLMLSVSAMVLPTLAYEMHLPAARHPQELAATCAVVLLLVFAVSTREMLRSGERSARSEASPFQDIWPLWRCVAVLAASGVAIVFLSDWFVQALTPATQQLGISETFAGMVVVAFASNTAGIAEIRLAIQGKIDLAVSVVLNGALQIAVAVIPILVLFSFFFTDTPFTLSIPPIMAVSLTLSVLVVTIVCVDGRADLVEGAALVGHYMLIASIFWWG